MAPTTSATPNNAPSRTRTECGCRSLATPGSASAIPLTPSATGTETESARRLSSRSAPNLSQSATATTATTAPPRE